MRKARRTHRSLRLAQGAAVLFVTGAAAFLTDPASAQTQAEPQVPQQQAEPETPPEPQPETPPAPVPPAQPPQIPQVQPQAQQQPAQAEPEDPARVARLTIGQQLALDNGDLIGVTPIDLQLESNTRGGQTLEFSMSLPLEQFNPNEDGTISLGDAQARLFYRRGVRNAAFETELSYRESDLDREILFDDLTNELITVDGGRVADSRARIGYSFGSQAKLGGEIGVLYARRDYSGVVDPDLDDSERLEGDLRLYLEPTPQIRARIIGTKTRVDTENGTDSRSTRVGVGASMQIDKLTNLDAEIAHSEIRRFEEDAETERTSGPSYRLRLTRSRPLGDWSLGFTSDPGTEGRRENLTLGRDLEMPRYRLNASVGVTRFQDNYDPIFQIGYDRNLNELSTVQLTLRRASVTDNDGDEAINTDLTTNYTQQIGLRSSLNASIRYRQTEVQTGDREDARSLALDLSFSRAIYSDISLVAGANIIRTKEQDGTRQDDERLYLGLSRSFDWIP